MTATTSVTQVGLRPVTDDDAALLRELFLAGRPELAALPGPVRDQIVELQCRAQRAQQDADHPAVRREIVVEHRRNGTVTDCGLLTTARDATTVHLIDLVVAVGHRCRGLASAVLARLAAEADERALDIRLHVWADNAPARRLYERLGFEYTTRHGAAHLGMRRPAQEGA